MRKKKYWGLATDFASKDSIIQTGHGAVSWWAWLEREMFRMASGPRGFETVVVEARDVPYLLKIKEKAIPGEHIALAYVRK